MRRILILADDLSGAADCANACLHSGLSAVVSFEESDLAVNSHVHSVDCDTRHLTPDDAFDRVAKIVRKHLKVADRPLLFKKIDSTLRGNIEAEIRAVLDERRKASSDNARVAAILAPAFPSGGRTTVAGYQLVHGVPLHETEMWRHEGLPGVAHIPTMLQRGGLRTTALNLEEVRKDATHLFSVMRAMAAQTDVIICDAETDEDLRMIAQAAYQLGDEVIWAGSAGLAYQLPWAAGFAGSAQRIEKPVCADAPLLFVVGSMSGVSHRQAALLDQEVSICTIRISPQILLHGSTKPEWIEIASRIMLSLDQGADTLIILDAAEQIHLHERRMLTDALGEMLSPCLGKVGGLAATGGETARAIFNGWGVASLRVIGEVESGIPCSLFEIAGRSIPVITKAGAFGANDALLSCWQFLTKLFDRRESLTLKKTS